MISVNPHQDFELKDLSGPRYPAIHRLSKELIISIFKFLNRPKEICVTEVCKLFLICGIKINLKARLRHDLWIKLFESTLAQLKFEQPATPLKKISQLFSNSLTLEGSNFATHFLNLRSNRERFYVLLDQLTWPIANHAEALQKISLKNIKLLQEITKKRPDLNHYELFLLGCARGEEKIVRDLLCSQQTIPVEIKKQGRQFAHFFGHLSVMQLLNDFSECKETGEDLLNLAIRNNYPLLINQLLQSKNLALPANYQAIKDASARGQLEALFALLQDERLNQAEGRKIALEKASRKGQLKFLRMILKDKHFHFPANYTYAIRCTSAEGHVKTTLSLLEDERHYSFNLSSGNQAVIEAVTNGHLDLVCNLIKEKQFNIWAYSYFALKTAINKEYVEIMQALLQDEPINQGFCGQLAIHIAVHIGKANIVRILLKDKRLDPTIDNHYALRAACQAGDKELVIALLEDPRVNQLEAIQVGLHVATVKGQAETVSLLLKSKCAKQIENFDIFLQIACKKGYFKVVQVLLKKRRLDLCFDNYYALRIASTYGYTEIVLALLDDKRIDRMTCGNMAIRIARYNNRHELIKELIKDKRLSQDGYYRIQDIKQLVNECFF